MACHQHDMLSIRVAITGWGCWGMMLLTFPELQAHAKANILVQLFHKLRVVLVL